MPFQKGHVKFGGKSKGCKNKISRDIVGLLDSLNCNPIEGLARIATDEKIDVSVRVHAYSRIARFVHPELRSVEVSGPGGKPIEVDIERTAVQRLADRVARAASRSGAA